MKSLWHRLFLEERPSISLSFFRMAVAFTTGAHVIPSFMHLDDNYFTTAFKTFNFSIFTPEVVQLVQKSPEWLIVLFVWIFCVSCFLFFIGFLSQLSCIAMTLACYYFYALNSFHVGTLSWDILLVTLFLMCLTPYHGDYFSLDCLIWGGEEAYKRKRPYFLQRLLQFQIGFTFFYTSLVKITEGGNWLTGNPIYNIMNAPVVGNTKLFLIRDYLMTQPQLCYVLGIIIVAIEFLMIFLLFWPKTRLSAIYLGCIFHVTLILTLDVPATFFFLFPPQLLLFINPQNIVNWIEQKRLYHQAGRQSQLIYDGQCRFCLKSVKRIMTMDVFGTLQYIDYHKTADLQALHPALSPPKVASQLHLVELTGKLYGGFDVFRRICFVMPMLYPFILIFYFPGMGFLGPRIYRFIANNRYLFHANASCRSNSCFR